ncbi:prolipoprotein diacylglyceryl transferase [Anaplasma phagocytophilum str. Norway variant2]|nr:prolipoprotein diacylglyceryl transferase [Anaplasma phagocytophilum]ANC34741.1 prolipoprotein diacylglyceryl transferase [Anaplasma phagocytophilum str. Norway variant2]
MSICFKIHTIVEWIANIDPVAFRLWFFKIHWYALSYIAGISFVYWYLGKVGKYLPLHKELLESLLSWAVLGAIIGGRAVYVLVYNPDFYFQFPLEIIKIWHGGMSFHGGFIGSITCTFAVCKKRKIAFASLLDLCACSIPLGLFLGRLTNLINGELYGRVTNSCIGIVFPRSGDMLPRHPSQLYEALFEGLIPLILFNVLLRITNIKQHPGMIACAFCVWYGTARCVIEFFREPDIQIGSVAFGWLTMGMLLSVPMILIPLIVFVVLVYKNVKYKTA